MIRTCRLLALLSALGLAGGLHAEPDEVTTVAQLLGAPGTADGRTVQVHGHLRPHVLYLFPNRELAEAQAWSSALIVDDPSGGIRKSACPDRLVTVSGRFRQLDPGIYGLVDIRRIRADGNVCWQSPAAP